MNELNYYYNEEYDFSEDTWRIIKFYENFFTEELRVANYNEGGVPEEYIKWAKNVVNSEEFEKITQMENDVFYRRKNRNKEFINRFYTINKLNKILNKNKYFVEKVSRFGLRFSYSDVQEFLLILKEAYEKDVLKEFLEVPDVWYIVRNIKENWKEVLGICSAFELYQSVAN